MSKYLLSYATQKLTITADSPKDARAKAVRIIARRYNIYLSPKWFKVTKVSSS